MNANLIFPVYDFVPPKCMENIYSSIRSANFPSFPTIWSFSVESE